MTKQIRVLLVLILAGGVAYGGWVFWSSLSTHKPHAQKIVDRSGVPIHYVEVWLDPNPPRAGERARITVRINYQMMRGGKAEELKITLASSNSSAVLTPPIHFYDEEDRRGEIYVASVTFPEPGDWNLAVTTRIQGIRTRRKFPLSVRS